MVFLLPFLPLIIMGNGRSLVDKMDELRAWKTPSFFSPRSGCRNNSNSFLLSFKTIRADRDCRQSGNSKGRGLQSLLRTDGVILDMSLRRSVSVGWEFLSTLSTERVHLCYLVTLCVTSSATLLLSYKTTPQPTDGDLWRFLTHLPLCYTLTFYFL